MARGKLYLMRHGESMGNVWPEAYKADERNFLTPFGTMQAQMTGHWLKRSGVQLDHVYSSNLTRARHTMALVLHETGWERHWINLPSLNELNDPDNPDEEARVRGAFHNIFSAWSEGNMLIVSHYYSMQVIFDYLPVERKNIPSHGGKHISNGVLFVWDADENKNWEITCPDMHWIGDQN